MAAKRPRFGFGPLTAVDPLEADMNRMVDLTGETTMASGPGMVDFLPKLGERPAAAPQAYKPSFMEMFDAVAGGDTITDARKRLIAEDRAAQDAETSRAKVQKLMATVFKDPREQLAFLKDPKEWAKAVSTNFGAANVGGGDTRVMPGYGAVTAPKIMAEGDSIIAADDEGMEVLGRREPSFAEKSKVEIAEKLAEIREMLAGNSIANTRSLIAKRSQPTGSDGSSSSRPVTGGSPWEKYRPKGAQ